MDTQQPKPLKQSQENVLFSVLAWELREKAQGTYRPWQTLIPDTQEKADRLVKKGFLRDNGAFMTRAGKTYVFAGDPAVKSRFDGYCKQAFLFPPYWFDYAYLQVGDVALFDGTMVGLVTEKHPDHTVVFSPSYPKLIINNTMEVLHLNSRHSRYSPRRLPNVAAYVGIEGDIYAEIYKSTDDQQWVLKSASLPPTPLAVARYGDNLARYTLCNQIDALLLQMAATIDKP